MNKKSSPTQTELVEMLEEWLLVPSPDDPDACEYYYDIEKRTLALLARCNKGDSDE